MGPAVHAARTAQGPAPPLILPEQAACITTLHACCRHQVPLRLRAPRTCRGNNAQGWPTTVTQGYWKSLVTGLGKYPWVWFGCVNEPQANWDGAQDAQVGGGGSGQSCGGGACPVGVC